MALGPIQVSCSSVVEHPAQFNVYLPHSMFSYSSIISNSLGAGALSKPYWAFKESPWYINLLISYTKFTWLCPICRYLFFVFYISSNR